VDRNQPCCYKLETLSKQSIVTDEETAHNRVLPMSQIGAVRKRRP